MGKMLEKYKNVSSADFKEEGLIRNKRDVSTSLDMTRQEGLPHRQAPSNDMLEYDINKKDSKDNNINGKFNSLRERWFCFFMNRQIDKLKRKVLARNKKIEA